MYNKKRKKKKKRKKEEDIFTLNSTKIYKIGIDVLMCNNTF